MSAAQPIGLGELLAPWAGVAGDTRIVDATLNSGEAGPGCLFLALQGARCHGADFVDQVLTRGVAAIAWEPAAEVDSEGLERRCRAFGVPAVAVSELSRHAGAVAARLFGDPSVAMPVVGVTGTDGKTSVTQFVAQALDDGEAGARCAVIGTVGCGFPGNVTPLTHTTPDAVTVQRLLAQCAAQGAQAVAMEVSSHALDQARVDAVRFDVAVLTNLSRDHLDYHGSQQAYAAAKARLFQRRGLGVAVLNLDDAFGRELADTCSAERLVGYSMTEAVRAEIHCLAVETQPAGLRLALRVDDRAVSVSVPLIGRFNAANTLAALGAVLALDRPLDEALQRLRRLRPVPGRMERFAAPDKPAVIVDYAHTPAALQAALAGAREHFAGELWCVFGCGGERDRGKRPMMGAIARASAEHVVLTNDNPRGENPHTIISDIRAGMGDNDRVVALPDRREALAWTLANASVQDVVVVAGKGHEDHQIVGEQRLPYSDRDTVRRLLGMAS